MLVAGDVADEAVIRPVEDHATAVKSDEKFW